MALQPIISAAAQTMTKGKNTDEDFRMAVFAGSAFRNYNRPPGTDEGRGAGDATNRLPAGHCRRDQDFLPRGGAPQCAHACNAPPVSVPLPSFTRTPSPPVGRLQPPPAVPTTSP